MPVEPDETDAETIAIDGFDAADPAGPLFDSVTKLAPLTLPGGDTTDVYLPAFADTDPLPLALVMQGFNVSKPNYRRFSSMLAAYGFVVLVPEHPGLLGIALAAELREIPEVLTFARAVNADPQSPLFGRIDTDTLVVLGHSYGGDAALNAAAARCAPPFCVGRFDRPPQLAGVAVFGADLRALVLTGPIPGVADTVPLAIIVGDRDGIAPPADAQTTFDRIEDAPRALMTIVGANHFAMTDTLSPVGIISDPVAPSIPQADAVEAVARGSAVFLRAFALGDADALAILDASATGQRTQLISPRAAINVQLVTEP